MSLPHHRGHHGERLAQHYLEKQGLVFITCNYRVKSGEIDLIMRDTVYLVFVEVRVRSRSTYGAGIETVNPNKQRRLIRAAQSYLQTHQLTDQVDCRFDVVGINAQDDITWIKNAFEVQY